MHAVHGTYSVRRVFINVSRHHLEPRLSERITPVSNSISITRILSVAVMGVIAAVAFAMILMPQPSLYAG
jgi:hypothetical protein